MADGQTITPLCTIERMTLVRRVLKLIGAALAFAVYVWLHALR